MSARPINETADDRARERTVISVIEARWQCIARKLPMSYRADYGLYRAHGLSAFAEVKVRAQVEIDQYPTYILSLQKWSACAALARSVGVSFIVVVCFADGLRWVNATDFGNEWRVDHGGRADRGQPGDMEPLVHIPMRQFRPLAAPATADL